MLPPGPRVPAVVQMLQWLSSPASYVERLGARWGDAFTTSTPLFGTVVNFSHPDALKQIFNGDASVFHAGEANAALAPFIGAQSVLLLDEAQHLHARRLMLPAFHGERMQRYTSAMREPVLRAIAKLKVGHTLSLQALFQGVTLEVILRAVLGLDGDALEATRAQLVRVLRLIQSPSSLLWSLPIFRGGLAKLTPWAAIQREIDATDRVLHQHIEQHRRGEGDPEDVLSTLMRAVDEDGEGLSDASLRDQLVTLLVAGHETTATTLSWFFEEILRIPGEDERLADEARGVLGAKLVEADDLPKLERLDSAIKETLRLHPVVGAVARKLKAPATIGGHDLPAGVTLVALLHLTHRRPEIYPSPERFVADRFIGKKIDPYAWAPFGGGIRRCLGMAFALHEMRVILATLLSSGLRFELVDARPYATMLRSVVYAPKGDTRVRVRRIDAEARTAA